VYWVGKVLTCSLALATYFRAMITQDDEDIIVNRLPIPPWQYRRGPPSSNSPSSSRQDLDSDVLPSYAAAVAAPTTLNTRLNPAVHAATTDRPPTYDSSTSSPSHTNQHPTVSCVFLLSGSLCSLLHLSAIDIDHRGL
jgi:hypothetical protein